MAGRTRITAAAGVAVAALVIGTGGLALAGDRPASPNDGGAPAPPPPTAQRAASATVGQNTFQPVPNCLLAKVKLANGTRNLKAAGPGSLAAQGGEAGGCGIPAYATSLTVQVMSAPAKKAKKPKKTNAATIYLAGVGAQAAVPVLVRPRNQSAAAGYTVAVGTGGQIALRNVGKPGTTTIEVLGYYAPQIFATLNSGGGILSGSPRVLSSTRTGTGSYRVQLDRTAQGCTPIASIDGSAFFASAYVSGTYIYANTYRPDGTAQDLYWTLAVFC